jgi:uncharacterized protein (DUF1697 family)
MKTFISILRGINVSGHKLIKMKLLQELFETMGFVNVRTYIQSGNVVFEYPPATPEILEAKISAGILASFGFDVPVIVMEKSDLVKIASENPFLTERHEDVSFMHVTFLSPEPAKDLVSQLREVHYPPDEFILQGNSVYLYCPKGYGNTKLSNTFFEKKLQVQATTRNWKTVLELIRISET